MSSSHGLVKDGRDGRSRPAAPVPSRRGANLPPPGLENGRDGRSIGTWAIKRGTAAAFRAWPERAVRGRAILRADGSSTLEISAAGARGGAAGWSGESAFAARGGVTTRPLIAPIAGTGARNPAALFRAACAFAGDCAFTARSDLGGAALGYPVPLTRSLSGSGWPCACGTRAVGTSRTVTSAFTAGTVGG